MMVSSRSPLDFLRGTQLCYGAASTRLCLPALSALALAWFHRWLRPSVISIAVAFIVTKTTEKQREGEEDSDVAINRVVVSCLYISSSPLCSRSVEQLSVFHNFMSFSFLNALLLLRFS